MTAHDRSVFRLLLHGIIYRFARDAPKDALRSTVQGILDDIERGEIKMDLHGGEAVDLREKASLLVRYIDKYNIHSTELLDALREALEAKP